MPYVEFSDATETKIISVFAGPQNAEDHPFMGEVDETDPRYIKFWEDFNATQPKN